MTIYVMPREVCLKHRNNRREMIPAGAPSYLQQVSRGAAVFVFFCRSAARAHDPRRSFAVIVQEPRCLNAIQGMPV
jgi:hypothetical protein